MVHYYRYIENNLSRMLLPSVSGYIRSTPMIPNPTSGVSVDVNTDDD